jgi:hypothetical protein
VVGFDFLNLLECLHQAANLRRLYLQHHSRKAAGFEFLPNACAFGFACRSGRFKSLADFGLHATAFHAGDRRPFVFGWLPVDALRLKRAVIYSLLVAVLFKRGIAQVGPTAAHLVGHVLYFLALAMDGVKFDGLLPKLASWRAIAGGKQDVGVVVFLVAVFARCVDGNVCGHTVAVGHLLCESNGQFLALFGCEFGRQSHFNFTSHNSIATLVMSLKPIPESCTVGGSATATWQD